MIFDWDLQDKASHWRKAQRLDEGHGMLGDDDTLTEAEVAELTPDERRKFEHEIAREKNR